MQNRSSAKVSFFYDQVKFSFDHRTRLKFFLENIFKQEKQDLESINYIFCTDKALIEMNRQFLQHDFYTDIISFDLSENSSTVIGEIYISVDRVKDNARLLSVSFRSELHRVIFHGALHLCGHNDKTDIDKVKMRNREDFYLDQYFK